MNPQPLWKLVLISIIVLIGSLIIAASVKDLFEVEPALDSRKSLFYRIAMLLFIAPVLEEFSFRYPCSFKKNHVVIGVASGWLLLITDFDKLLTFSFSWVNVGAILGSVILVYILKMVLTETILKSLFRYRIKVFYALAILFSVGHVNWELGLITLIITPFLLLPTFSFGIIMINFRLKYNILTTILIHGFINSLFLLRYV